MCLTCDPIIDFPVIGRFVDKSVIHGQLPFCKLLQILSSKGTETELYWYTLNIKEHRLCT